MAKVKEHMKSVSGDATEDIMQHNQRVIQSMGGDAYKSRISVGPPLLPPQFKSVPVQKPDKDTVLKFKPMESVDSPEDARLLKVSIMGTPNAGKSTLLNSLIRSKAAITSANPHTTVSPVITSYTHQDSQIVFIDTPGVMMFKNTGIKGLQRQQALMPWNSLNDADLAMVVVDATSVKPTSQQPISQELEWMLKKLRFLDTEPTSNLDAFLVLNKIDRINDMRRLVEISDYLNEVYRKFQATYMVSSRFDTGMEELRQALFKDTKKAPWIYNSKERLCIPPAMIVTEILRGRLFEASESREIPFWLAYKNVIEVTGWTPLRYSNTSDNNTSTEEDALRIDIRLSVKRQKDFQYLVRKDGAILQKIRQLTSHDIQRVLKKQVYLYIHARSMDSV